MLKVENPSTGKQIKILWKHYAPNPNCKDYSSLPKDIRDRIISTNIAGASQCLIVEGTPPARLEDCNLISIVTTQCSIHDQFSRKKGRKLSLARALKKSNYDHNIKYSIWHEYKKMQNNKW
jgi:hypothetical protein